MVKKSERVKDTNKGLNLKGLIKQALAWEGMTGKGMVRGVEIGCNSLYEDQRRHEDLTLKLLQRMIPCRSYPAEL